MPERTLAVMATIEVGTDEVVLTSACRGIHPTSIALGCMMAAVITNNDPDAAYHRIHEIPEDPWTHSLMIAVTDGSIIKGVRVQRRFECAWGVYQRRLRKR